MRSAIALMATVFVAVWLAGCGDLKLAPPDNKEAARQHWVQVRARMKLQLAREHLRTGRLAEAETQLRDILSLDPKCGPGHVLAARLALEKGDLAAARSALGSAIELGGESEETDYLLGVLAEWSGDLTGALGHFRRASQRGSPSVECLVAECEVLVALGRPDEALDLIEKHRGDFPGNQAICTLEGDIRTLRGQYAEAADAYRRVALAAPADVQAQIQFGAALARCGRYDEAIVVFTRLRDDRRALPWTAYHSLGRAYLEKGNVVAAAEVFGEAARLNPNQAEPELWLAHVAAVQGDWASARQRASRVLQMDSRHDDARLLLGYACLRSGDLDRARQALEVVLRNSPRDRGAHYLMGQVLESAGLGNEAAVHYRQADQAAAPDPAGPSLAATDQPE